MQLWLIYIIIALVTESVFALLSKKVLSVDDVDPRIYGSLMQILVGLMGFGLVIFNGFNFEFTYYSTGLLLLMGLAYTVAASSYYVGLKGIEISKGIIYESTSVFWSFVLGLLILSEDFSIQKIVGVVLIFSAIFILSYKKSQKINLGKYELLIILSGLFYSFAAVIDKVLLNFSDPITYLAINFLIAGTMMLATNICRLKKIALPLVRNRNFMKQLFIACSFILVSVLALFKAYDIGGEVSVLYPIYSTKAILTAVLGVVFLKEENNLIKKGFALILSFIGVVLMSI